jgi:outer membrane protein TolC
VALSLFKSHCDWRISSDLKSGLVPTLFFANIITGLTQPIFNQRQVRTKFEVAKANQEKAYLQFEQSLLLLVKKFQML